MFNLFNKIVNNLSNLSLYVLNKKVLKLNYAQFILDYEITIMHIKGQRVHSNNQWFQNDFHRRLEAKGHDPKCPFVTREKTFHVWSRLIPREGRMKWEMALIDSQTQK